MSLAEDVRAWVRDRDPALVAELAEWIKQPSVSRTGDGMAGAAEHGLDLLRRSGLTAHAIETPGWPALLGTSDGPADAPHVLVYGHYDVQPAGPLDEWDSPPFEPTIRDGRMYGRGTGDNKGQHLAQLLGLRALAELGHPRCRISVLLDGEEEIGSPNLAAALRALPERPDLVLWSDGPVHESGRAVVVLGVRGVAAFQLRIRGATAPLHSGNWGGVAPNPAWRLVHVLAGMRSPDGRILVDGVTDGIVPLTNGERQALSAIPVDVDEALAGIGVTAMEPPDDVGYYERLTGPTFSINSLTCEDAGEHRTVIPHVAVAKCDLRLTGGQRADEVFAAIRAHLERYAPDVEFLAGAAMDPQRTLPESTWTQAVLDGAEAGLGERPLLLPALGGSLPIAPFDDELGVPCYGVPLANVDERNHAPNENLDLDWFRRGIVAAATVQEALLG